MRKVGSQPTEILSNSMKFIVPKNKIQNLTDPVQPGLFYIQPRYSLIDSVMVCGNIFKALLIPNRKSQRAEILRECSSHTLCHVSRIMCHVSHVTCHMSHVTCHLSHVKNIFLTHFYLKKKNKNKKSNFFYTIKILVKVVELVDGGSVIKRAHPVQFLQVY